MLIISTPMQSRTRSRNSSRLGRTIASSIPGTPVPDAALARLNPLSKVQLASIRSSWRNGGPSAVLCYPALFTAGLFVFLFLISHVTFLPLQVTCSACRLLEGSNSCSQAYAARVLTTRDIQQGTANPCTTRSCDGLGINLLNTRYCRSE